MSVCSSPTFLSIEILKQDFKPGLTRYGYSVNKIFKLFLFRNNVDIKNLAMCCSYAANMRNKVLSKTEILFLKILKVNGKQ